MVVGSTTLQPGKETDVFAHFTMHEGMGGPHLFIVHLLTNDSLQPERGLTIRSFWGP